MRLYTGLIIFIASAAYGNDVTPQSSNTTDNNQQAIISAEPYSSDEPDLGGSGMIGTQATINDYARIAKAKRAAGCAIAQIDDSIPFPTAVVDLDIFFSIQGRAKWLPPYPKKPNTTIHGVDADGDCVRDDIEHYIAKKYRNKDQYKLRKYLYEYTVWMDKFLISGLNVNTAKTSFNNMAAAGECVSREVGDDNVEGVINDLFAKFHNTWPRTDRYIYNLRQTSGWTTRETLSISCP